MKLLILLAIVFVTKVIGLNLSHSDVHRLSKRDAESDKYLSKFSNCVRNRFGSTSTQLWKEERCAFKHMKRVLVTRDRVACKLCDPFFVCKGSEEARKECGPHHHVKATLETITQCQEIQSTGSGEDVSEAVDVGWSGSYGTCARSLLCATGCRYASSNDTCTSTCR